mgnify:CR=1 FL=1
MDSPFCPQCGQKNKDYSLSLKELFSHFLEELLDVDARVLRSLRLLFTRPGFLSKEYVLGRRVSYIPPVRIYLVASVLFFLSLTINTLVPSFQNNPFIKELAETGDLEQALENELTENAEEPQSTGSPFPEGSGLVKLDPDSSASGAVMTIGESRFDMQEGDFLSNFSDNFAKMMFFLLPVAALQLKALYWRRKKVYVEHLIFSLHVHAFIFSILILTVIMDFKFVMWFVILWSLIYLYLAMKYFYNQSYGKTLSKMLLLLFGYGLTILLVMTLTMVLTAISLVVGT